jgi:uncharacterized protein YbjT (DUF2867 family)
VILLVGGTGFLGSFVAACVAERRPAVLVRPTSDVSVLPHGLELRRGDLRDTLPLEGISTLIYCASMGFGQIPSLIEQLERSGVKRAVFISTTAIFTRLPSPSRALRLEAEAAVQNSQLEWTILRPTMIYGTARDRNISRLLKFLRRSPVFPLCGNALWQPIYVEDLADAVVAALDSTVTHRKTYIVAGAEPLRFSELVKTAARAIRRDIQLIPVPVKAAVLAARITRIVTPEQIRRLAEDKAFSYADAAHDFNFAPRSFATGVQLEAATLVA